MPAERSNGKVKRPPNAWILFRSDVARAIAHDEELHPELPRRTQAQISKEISHLWNTLDPQRKAEYERRAEAKKHEHSLLYPDYRFQPMKKEEKERQKQLKKQKDKEERYRQRNEAVASSSRLQSATASPAPHPASLPASGVPPNFPSSSTPTQHSQSTHSTPLFPQTSLSQSPQNPAAVELFGPSPPLCAADSPSDTTYGGDSLQALLLQPPPLDLSATNISHEALAHSIASPAPSTPWTPALSEADATWNNPDHVPWQDIPAPAALEPNFLRLDVPLPPQTPWSADGETTFDQSLQAIINSSSNPSIFHLDNFDPNTFSEGAPLDIQLGDVGSGMDLSMFSYAEWADVLADYLPNNNNFAPSDATAAGSTFNDGRLPSNPQSSYSGEFEDNLNQFVDLDGTASQQQPAPPPPPAHIPSPPASDHSSDASSSTGSSYAPPMYTNQRRAGGTWRPPQSFGEVSVQPWKVRAN
ncbi:hypothetical protein PQX77_007731 [Marasmius sp. AFHP31]|nr:hypothetical protein PQX77_007731 [Marasmius sp. AFHP31]